MLPTALLTMASSASFLLTQNWQPWGGSAHSGLVSHEHHENARTELPTGQSDDGTASIEILSPQMTLAVSNGKKKQ